MTMVSIGGNLLGEVLDYYLHQGIAALTHGFALTVMAWQQGPSPLSEKAVTGLQRSLHPYVMLMLMASCIIGAARMAWERQAEPGRRLLHSLLLASIVTAGSVMIIAAGIEASDAMASHLFPTESVAELGTRLEAAADSGAKEAGLRLLIILLTQIALVGTAVQVVILFLRSVGLTVLTVIVPMAAAFTNLDLGRAWFHKTLTWVLALILYKPAAAIVYLIAFTVMDTALAGDKQTADEGVYSFMLGATTILLSVFTLPLLVKLVTPAIGVVAAGSLGGGFSPAPGQAPTGAASTTSPSPGAVSGVASAGAGRSVLGSTGPTGGASSGGSGGQASTPAVGPGPAGGGTGAAGLTGVGSASPRGGGLALAGRASTVLTGVTAGAAAAAGAAQRTAQISHGLAQTATGDGPAGSQDQPAERS